MRKLMMLSLLIFPLATLGLSACGDENDDPSIIGAGGTGGTGGTGGDGGTGGGGGTECENSELLCDECVTPEENSYQACSQFTDGCLPFDNAGRIAGYPSNIPVVP